MIGVNLLAQRATAASAWHGTDPARQDWVLRVEGTRHDKL
jgi:hypothetical protein